MTLREIVYMIMDELKLMSDDSSFNEDHIKFLVNKYRAQLLRQVYSKDTTPPSNNNYQTIEVTFKNTMDNDVYFSNKVNYLQSTDTIPTLMSMSNTTATVKDSRYGYVVSLIPKERMKFVGYNKWLKNIIYCTIDDNTVYAYTFHEDIEDSFTLLIKGIFEDAETAGDINFMESEYPLDHSLVPALIQSVVQELAPKTVQPEDSYNNASDDKANIANYIARNQKQNIQ